MGVSRRRQRRGGGLCRMLMPPGGELRSEMDCSEDYAHNHQSRQNNYQSHLQVARVCLDRRVSDDPRFGAAFRLESIFRDQAIFVETKEARNCADESAIENAAGQLVPLLVFQSHKKSRRNARGGGNFFQRDASHFPLAF